MNTKKALHRPDCRFTYERIDRSQNGEQEEGYRITHSDRNKAVAQKRLDFMKDQKIFTGSDNSIISYYGDHLALSCLFVRYHFKDYILTIERSDNTVLSCSKNSVDRPDANIKTEATEPPSVTERLSPVPVQGNQIRPAYKYDVAWYPASDNLSRYVLIFLLLVFLLTSVSLSYVCFYQARSQIELNDSNFNIARLTKAVNHLKYDNNGDVLSGDFDAQWQNFINQKEFTDLLAKEHDVDCIKVEWFGEKGDPVPEIRSFFINSSTLRSLKELIIALNIICSENVERTEVGNDSLR